MTTALLAVAASAAEARGGHGGGSRSVSEGRMFHERGHVTSPVRLLPQQRTIIPGGGYQPRPRLPRVMIHPKVPLVVTQKPSIWKRFPLVNAHKPPIKDPPIGCHAPVCGSHGHHTPGHHTPGHWWYGGAVSSAGYGGCTYEYHRWQSGGSPYWKARYLACQAG